MSSAQLSDDFYVSEDLPSIAMMWGWALSAAQWLAHPQREALARLTAPRGRLERAIGALSLDEPLELGPIIVGLRVSLPEEGLTSAQINAVRAKLLKRVASLDAALIPAALTQPQLYLIAQGALCNAVLVFGERGAARPEVVVSRAARCGDRHLRFDWYHHHSSASQDSERGGVTGLRIAQAGPWRSPMVCAVPWASLNQRALKGELRGLDARYHLLYQYGN